MLTSDKLISAYTKCDCSNALQHLIMYICCVSVLLYWSRSEYTHIACYRYTSFLLPMKVCKLRVCFIKIVPWSLWQLIVELDWPYCSWWTFRLLSNISYHSAYQVSLVECTVPLMLLDIGSHRTICVQSWRSHGGDWWREGKSTCCCY